jgi:hypothetical protein
MKMIRTEWLHRSGQKVTATYTPETWAKRKAQILAHGDTIIKEEVVTLTMKREGERH